MRRLKILHVWNTAGVPQVIAKYQLKLDQDPLVYTRKKAEKFGIGLLAPEVVKLSSLPPKLFVLKVLAMVRKFDIIHVHSLDKIVPILKKLYPKKPVLLTYHGSEIRNKWEIKEKLWKKADIVTVATPDLLKKSPKEIIYIPNPVDFDMFNKEVTINNKKRLKQTALFIYNKNIPSSLEWAKEQAFLYGYKLKVLDREKEHIPYSRMPWFLSTYELFIDRIDIPSLSKTALEALALGIPVINWEGKKIEQFPEDHDPYVVAEEWLEVYCELIKK